MDTAAVLNKTLLQDTKTRTDICSKICNQKACKETFSVTDVSSSEYLQNGLISIGSSCSNKPVVTIEYLPRITFMEFVMYISSSLGIWFGISVLSINPFNRSKCGGVARTIKTRKHYSYGNESRDFRETLRMAVQDLNRRVKQIESNQLY